MQAFKIHDTSGTNIEDFMQLIVDLLSFGQTLCKKPHGIDERLCHAVTHLDGNSRHPSQAHLREIRCAL